MENRSNRREENQSLKKKRHEANELDRLAAFRGYACGIVEKSLVLTTR